MATSGSAHDGSSASSPARPSERTGNPPIPADDIQSDLYRSVISMPLLEQMRQARPDALLDVVIDINLDYTGGRAAAIARVHDLIENAPGPRAIRAPIATDSSQYVVARMPASMIRQVVGSDQRAGERSQRAIFHVWPDFVVRALLDRSISTVKVDAVHSAFTASGAGITWAVLDTGVQADARHFTRFKNLSVPGLPHLDFTGNGDRADRDAHGHGTHVAGIIAGWAESTKSRPLRAVRFERNQAGDVAPQPIDPQLLSGLAPQCKIVSYKVLGDDGVGTTSAVLNAIDHIQEVNGYGRMLKIHGVNLSLGYDFNPRWFACGQSPICVEVDRLVRTGVVVVVAAGNTGYAYATDEATRMPTAAGRALTINDPGNAALAITVGSTHRDMPHTYGVSYFSSKGPTGDGRAKPDLVAPGERILSAAAGRMQLDAQQGRQRADYVESSGTSMAAPHVSGVVAGFLSVRNEFIGHPDRVKDIFTGTATDLGRVRDFQGHGLIDAMRAIQSV